MLFLVELHFACLLKDSKVKVSETEPKSGENIAPVKTHVLVFFRRVWRDHVENHTEHDDQDDEEQHEDLQVNDDVDDHGHDVTKTLYDPHEEKGFDQAYNGDKNHANLGTQFPSSNIQLTEDVVVPQSDVHDVHVIPWVCQVLGSLLQGLGTIVNKWVQ
jgi:hypothetical protein